MKLVMQIEMEVQKGNILPIHPIHLVLNIISMCVFPFVARPMMQHILQVEDEAYLDLMKTSKGVIMEFVRNALAVKG
jgi:hypothetical protein